MTRKASPRKVVTLVAAAAVAGSGLVMGGVANAAVSKSGAAAPSVGSSTVARVVTITGKGFTGMSGAAKVIAGNGTCTGTAASIATASAAVTYRVVSDTRLVATIPTLGTPPVSPATTTAAKLCFLDGTTYMTVPYTYAIQPATATTATTAGPSIGGQKMTITTPVATPFRKDSKVVTFDGVPAKDVKVSSDGRSITLVTPAGAAGTPSIAVKTPGFADVPVTGYTYQRAIKVSPATLPVGGGTITITGSGFGNTTTFPTLDVFTGTVACSDVRLVSDKELTCLAQAGSGPVAVAVGTLSGGTALTDLVAGSRSVVSSTSTLTYAAY